MTFRTGGMQDCGRQDRNSGCGSAAGNVLTRNKINSGVADLDGRTKRKQIRMAVNTF